LVPPNGYLFKAGSLNSKPKYGFVGMGEPGLSTMRIAGKPNYIARNHTSANFFECQNPGCA
jgi:hypothetical protein